MSQHERQKSSSAVMIPEASIIICNNSQSERALHLKYDSCSRLWRHFIGISNGVGAL